MGGLAHPTCQEEVERNYSSLVGHGTIGNLFLCPFESWSNPWFDQDLNKFKTWKWKGKPASILVTLKWSIWEVFEVSMFETQNHFSSCLIDFIRQSLGLVGRYMICLVWICLDLVYQLEWLQYDIRILCALVFIFYLFWIFMPIWSWSNPRFNQDLNKFKTWKWKGKPVSFLVTPKWGFWEGFWNFHVWNPKRLLVVLDFIRQSLGLGVDTLFFWFEYV
jgi:hypothetical protein